MTDRKNRFSLRFLFECILCAMAIGTYAAILIRGPQGEWTLEVFLMCIVVGGVIGILLWPLGCGFIPLDANATATLNAWPEIAVSFGVLLAIAASQIPRPETAAAIRGLGPICRGLLWVFRYLRFIWLFFIFTGTAIGILCIMYLRQPKSQTEKDSGEELRSQDNPVDAEPTVDD